MPEIIYVETTPAEREAAKLELLRALLEAGSRLRVLRAARENSVVKEQNLNNSLPQINEDVLR